MYQEREGRAELFGAARPEGRRSFRKLLVRILLSLPGVVAGFLKTSPKGLSLRFQGSAFRLHPKHLFVAQSWAALAGQCGQSRRHRTGRRKPLG